MKKFLAVFMTLVMAAVLLVGCASGDKEPTDNDKQTPAPAGNVKLYHGLGTAANFRNGPGSDSEGVPVYSFNFVFASAIFDEEGKVVDAEVDILEVSTPNYDGAGMPHFSGWPGKEGYNITDEDTGKVTGVSENTEESAQKEISEWATKRERGDNYHMNPDNDWHKQMDAFEDWFKGKTVAEIEEAFNTMFSDRNGRPLDPNTDNEEDKAKVDKLTDEQKAEVEDLRSGATMSLRDAHGDILGALKDAYENRKEIAASAD